MQIDKQTYTSLLHKIVSLKDDMHIQSVDLKVALSCQVNVNSKVKRKLSLTSPAEAIKSGFF